MRHQDEAYDLSLFAPKRQEELEPQRKQNIIELPQKQLEQNRRNKLQPLHAVATFLSMAVIVGIVGTMVYSQVQLTELTEELNSATKQLEESKSVYTQLKMKSDSQLSLETVENYAKDELGMRKISQNQVECISLSEGDKGAVLEDAAGGNWWTNLWNTIQNLLS